MTPAELYHQARRLGLRLEARGDKIAVIPKGKCSDEFAEVLKMHKAELLAWLSAPTETRASEPLPTTEEILRDYPTGAPAPPRPAQRGGSFEQWIVIAKRIALGEFDGADGNMREALRIGLRGFGWHPAVKRALKRIEGQNE